MEIFCSCRICWPVFDWGWNFRTIESLLGTTVESISSRRHERSLSEALLLSSFFLEIFDGVELNLLLTRFEILERRFAVLLGVFVTDAGILGVAGAHTDMPGLVSLTISTDPGVLLNITEFMDTDEQDMEDVKLSRSCPFFGFGDNVLLSMSGMSTLGCISASK